MSRFNRQHIRTRLTIYFMAVLAVIVLLYSSAACLLLLRDLRSQVVRHAIQDIETVEGLLYFTPQGQLRLRDDYHNHPESKQVLERLVEVRSPDGAVLYRNELLGSRSLGDTLLPNEGEGGYSAREVVLEDGLRVQLVSRRHAFDGRPTVIRVAYSQEPLWQQFRADLMALLIPIPLVLFIAGLGGYALASRALRPINVLARKAQDIRSDRLQERLPVNSSDGELADLARAFNSVLGQLEQAFEQLRRFTSDASHELRTPLAAIRSVGEVGLQRQGGVDAYRDVIGSMLEEANKLARLVDSLLTIARTDSGQISLQRSLFSMSDLVLECAALFDVLIEENLQKLELDVSVDAPVLGDRLLLRQAVLNVLHNAIKFTPRQGRIVARVAATGNEVITEIEDSGPGIPDEHLTRIFDRFYRVQEGRSPGGAGLGLSISQWTIESHGGTITAHSRPDAGCTFRIVLPLAERSAAVPPRLRGGLPYVATEPAPQS